MRRRAGTLDTGDLTRCFREAEAALARIGGEAAQLRAIADRWACPPPGELEAMLRRIPTLEPELAVAVASPTILDTLLPPPEENAAQEFSLRPAARGPVRAKRKPASSAGSPPARRPRERVRAPDVSDVVAAVDLQEREQSGIHRRDELERTRKRRRAG